MSVSTVEIGGMVMVPGEQEEAVRVVPETSAADVGAAILQVMGTQVGSALAPNLGGQPGFNSAMKFTGDRE